MGHKSLETTMRYLAPATDVPDVLGPGGYSVRREGCPGAAKVCRARDGNTSKGTARTVARSGGIRRSCENCLMMLRKGACGERAVP